MVAAFLDGILTALGLVAVLAYFLVGVIIARAGFVGGVLGVVMWYGGMIVLAMRNGVWSDPRLQRAAGICFTLCLLMVLAATAYDSTSPSSTH